MGYKVAQPTAEYIAGNEEDILERWWLFVIFKGHKVQLCIKLSQNLSIESKVEVHFMSKNDTKEKMINSDPPSSETTD